MSGSTTDLKVKYFLEKVFQGMLILKFVVEVKIVLLLFTVLKLQYVLHHKFWVLLYIPWTFPFGMKVIRIVINGKETIK